jgi:hypothetical protein
MQNYEVGQILFMTSLKRMNIIPVQVVEEVIRTTLTGKEKTYMIKLPDKNSTVADISHVKGKLFTSKLAVRAYMIENATGAIDNMVAEAEILKAEVFGKDLNDENESTEEQNVQNVQINKNSDIIMIDIGNGVKAKINKNELEKVN